MPTTSKPCEHAFENRGNEGQTGHPAIGSPRYAHELNLPGLRCLTLTRYPHIVFYVERDDYIDVWRVLHGMRDIPSSLRDEGDDTN